MLEAVVNVSEGRDHAVLDALAAACGGALLDLHSDPDHNRSVLTLATSEPGGADAAVRRLATVVAEDVSLVDHTGVHPRLGALDVVPFVALPPTPADVAVAAARAFGHWLATTMGVPVFFYDAADPSGRTLPDTRADAFVARAPDVGPAAAHPRLGATAIGARPPLIAVNVELDRDDLPLARSVAKGVRERDGGLAGVRALGFRLESSGHAQVSMNLVDLPTTSLERACNEVRDRLRREGVGVARVEIVGLVPAAELDRCSDRFVEWSGISSEQTIEARAARAAGAGAGATPGEVRDRPA
jgi:glutamate formiminotransferase